MASVNINDINFSAAGPRLVNLRNGELINLTGHVVVNEGEGTFGLLISQMLTLLTAQQNEINDMKSQLATMTSGLKAAAGVVEEPAS